MSADAPPPLAAGRSPLVLALLLLALVANLVALGLPLVDIQALVVKRKLVGLTNSAGLLWQHRLYALAALALVLSVVFPLVKLAVLGWVWWGRGASRAQRRALRFVEALGKWSLFDVFLMAILLGLTRDQAWYTVVVAPRAGLAAFIVAVALAMLAGELLTRRHAAHAPPSFRPSPRPPAVTAPLAALAGLTAGAALALPVLALHDPRLAPATLTIVEVVRASWAGGATTLAACCAATLLLFPLLALGGAALATCAGGSSAWRWLGRWAMLEVFALALVVFAVEGGSFVTADLRPGAAVLAAAVVLRWLLGWWGRGRGGEGPRAGG